MRCRRHELAFFRGTLAPFLRASESPIAIACLRLVTLPPLPPLPERSVPRFSRCIALSTLLPAALPYLAIAYLLFFDSRNYFDEPLKLSLFFAVLGTTTSVLYARVNSSTCFCAASLATP